MIFRQLSWIGVSGIIAFGVYLAVGGEKLSSLISKLPLRKSNLAFFDDSTRPDFESE